MSMVMLSWFRQFESSRPFTEDEAWLLFRLVAIGEAVGWTLLITGILWKHFLTPGNNLPVLLAGQVHGLIFLAYLVAAAGLYPSLRWGRGQAALAVLASVPPYGSLLFEQWAAHRRRRSQLAGYGRFLLFTALPKAG
jgi:integral membrane protein